jgi:hypothetical protein
MHPRAWLALLLLVGTGCTIERRPEGKPYADDFDRAELGPAWRNTGANYHLDKGELVVSMAHNHPLWLTSPIPRDALIELDAWSNDDAGDIKLEVWGDGKSYAKSLEYTATSYVFIFGGWHNRLAVIARMNEHGADRKEKAGFPVEKGRKYHFRIERRGGQIDWQIDGQPFMAYDDKRALDGPDHAYLGFNDWEAELHFDNLKITPL